MEAAGGTLSGAYTSASGAQCAAASAADSRVPRSAAASLDGSGGRVENSICAWLQIRRSAKQGQFLRDSLLNSRTTGVRAYSSRRCASSPSVSAPKPPASCARSWKPPSVSHSSAKYLRLPCVVVPMQQQHEWSAQYDGNAM